MRIQVGFIVRRWWCWHKRWEWAIQHLGQGPFAMVGLDIDGVVLSSLIQLPTRVNIKVTKCA
jgi:hypothetical protein